MYAVTTMEDYYALSQDQKRDFRENEVKKQNGKCLLCGDPFPKRYRSTISMPVVDHDHLTSQIRGILHSQCNVDLHVVEIHLDDGWIDQARDFILKSRP